VTERCQSHEAFRAERVDEKDFSGRATTVNDGDLLNAGSAQGVDDGINAEAVAHNRSPWATA
jgi:hypothetical protein